MAKKSKKNRRNLSEKVTQRKSAFETKANPFELKINRQKHEILGRKAKHSQGLPGVARSKAVAKRKETLLLEYKQRNKANKFADKRLGEYETDVTPEEKMLARFAAERKANHGKVDIFNLNDDEELTHFGQSLADVEKFDDPRSDSEDDGNNLGAEFVKNAHFGGFLTKKEHDDDDGEKDGTKLRKDLIDDLIAKSKLRKYEKQQQRETNLDLTEKLDADWKTIRGLLPPAKKSDVESTKLQLDDYDLIVREMKFEQRAKALDRLKTPEEIAHEEREKLEKLEIERIQRMKGDDEKVALNIHTTKNHCSADDLDDGFQLTKYDKEFWVSYKDGKLENDPLSKSQNVVDDVESEEMDNNGKPQEGEEEDSDEDESEEEVSDIDESVEESENENLENIEITLKATNKNVINKRASDAEAELSFIYAVPLSYEEFLDLIERHSVVNQLVIVDRIIKCYHPCLAEGNREKLEAFYPMLLQLVNDAVSQDKPVLQLVDGLLPHLYDITQFSPLNCAQCILEVILEKQHTFHKACIERASNQTAFPSFDTVIFFTLVLKLFPTSDFQHLVVTPTMLFMGQILMQCTVAQSSDIVGGIFICSLFLEYVSMSKRFVSEAISFLGGIFYSALKKDSVQSAITVPSFKRNSVAARLMELQENCSNLKFESKPLSISLACNGENITDELRLHILNTCFKLLCKYAVLYEMMPSYEDIFTFFTKNHKHLPIESFPQELKKNLDNFLSQVNKSKPCKRSSLIQEQKKPQPLKLLEPRIEDQFDGRKHKKGSKESLEKQRLLHRYKRELKGAVRELRRDNQFLAKQRLDDQLERDGDRKRKLKELYHDLATQEGNCKAIERVKKKK